MELGSTIAGKYTITRKLGAGGFASVYEARDLTTQRVVAVKILERDNKPDRDVAIVRFQREAHVLLALRSQHTVALLEHGESDGSYYMVFEYLNGENLHDVLQRGPLPALAVGTIVRQLLMSLAEAHAHGIIHRDIKPANIMLTPHPAAPWFVKLIDFGIALPDPGVDDDVLTRTGYAVGTPLFMAPEQLFGAPATIGSDLYAVGLVACDMLLGLKVLDRASLGDGSYPRLPCDEHLTAVIHRLIHHIPAQRFPRAEDAIAALDGGPVWQAAPRSTDLVVLRRRRLRDVIPQILVVTSVVVVISMLTAWALSLFAKPDPPQRPLPPRVNFAHQTSEEAAQSVEVVEDVSIEEPVECEPVPGRSTHAISRGLDPLNWVLHVPPTAKRDGPLLLFFHGAGHDPEDYLNGGLAELAEELGVVIAAPIGTDTFAWAHHSPTPWLNALLDDAAQRACVNTDVVLLMANDTGGFPTQSAVCDPRIAAFVTTSYRPLVGQQLTCEDRPVPRLIINPTRSRHIPLHGGVDCAVGPPHLALREHHDWWKKRNACSGRPAQTELDGLTCDSWTCEAPLVSCVIKGGQQWPNMASRVFDVFNCDRGKYSHDFLGAVRDFLREQIADSSE